MILQSKDLFLELKKIISREKKLAKEIIQLKENLGKENGGNKQVIETHINSLKKALEVENENLRGLVEKLNIAQPLNEKLGLIEGNVQKIKDDSIGGRLKQFLTSYKKGSFSGLEKESLKRVKEEEKKVIEKKGKEISTYILFSNKFFGNFAAAITKKHVFRELERDLIKSNLQLVPKTYISIMFFTAFLSLISAGILFLFFFFFSITATLPIITFATDSFGLRLLKVFWIPIAMPIATVIIMYYYPSMEKKLHENQINVELPFAAIHMSAISGSMIDPTKIFSIIISTKEYPYISKEFTKLLNQINVYGDDIVGALRELSFTTANQKFSEVLNGLSTTINTGGDIAQFFEKRAESLLFDYKIDRERETKNAETFMDVYISIVIAAPMIFMLLLMMMKISGLGIALSTSMISLIMVTGVALINIGFLVFLQLKQPVQ